MTIITTTITTGGPPPPTSTIDVAQADVQASVLQLLTDYYGQGSAPDNAWLPLNANAVEVTCASNDFFQTTSPGTCNDAYGNVQFTISLTLPAHQAPLLVRLLDQIVSVAQSLDQWPASSVPGSGSHLTVNSDFVLLYPGDLYVDGINANIDNLPNGQGFAVSWNTMNMSVLADGAACFFVYPLSTASEYFPRTMHKVFNYLDYDYSAAMQ